jgi:coenzyme F420-0:L-glutamate ligase / coenzyme F420-1:gamma-L-glutamate ligase
MMHWSFETVSDELSAPEDARVAELSQAIHARRSIRRFRDGDVPREVVLELIEAAGRAPSPHNRQPWRFAVLPGNEGKARLARSMGERLRADRTRDGDSVEDIEADVARSRARIEGAAIVLVAALTMRDMDHYADARRSEAERIMAVQATAAAVQNILLLAQARGFGACWMCAPLFCAGTVRAALGLPEDWEPQALVTLGIPDSGARERPRLGIDETSIWLEDANVPVPRCATS